MSEPATDAAPPSPFLCPRLAAVRDTQRRQRRRRPRQVPRLLVPRWRGVGPPQDRRQRGPLHAHRRVAVRGLGEGVRRAVTSAARRRCRHSCQADNVIKEAGAVQRATSARQVHRAGLGHEAAGVARRTSTRVDLRASAFHETFFIGQGHSPTYKNLRGVCACIRGGK